METEFISEKYAGALKGCWVFSQSNQATGWAGMLQTQEALEQGPGLVKTHSPLFPSPWVLSFPFPVADCLFPLGRKPDPVSSKLYGL